MSDPINWNKPIEPRPAVSIVTGRSTPGSPFLGIREEQIRRAQILVAAAGGPKLTKATVRRAVQRLAATVPGLRYKSGMAVFSGLAPNTSLFGDDLPGKEVGRERYWSEARRRLLQAQVAEIQAAQTGMSMTDALRILRERLRVERKYPPSLKTLQNQLSKRAR